MKGAGGVVQRRDAGLSEVVGFVLIIALITVAFSLYLAYGVPAQGRENEILHMGVVKDQFISYKIGLDSLATNDKLGTTLSNSFTLGSEESYTQGVMGFIPIMKPVSSGGTFSINRRTSDPETLSITSRSLILNNSLPSVPFTPSKQLPVNPAPPSQLAVYVDTSLPGVSRSDVSVPYGIDLVGISPTTIPSWEVFINLTPRLMHYKYMQCNYENIGGTAPACTSQTTVEGDTYNSTDLTITVFKAGNKTLDNFIINSNIQNNPRNYSVNLMDDAYGLKNYIGNETITNAISNATLSPIGFVGEVRYPSDEELFISSPITLGAVDFRSQNNYWISQEYYYQMGGVFLSQIEGNDTYKLPPEITFFLDTSNPSRPITDVTINAVSITNPYGGSVVGGTSPVQIKTTLNSLYTFPYVNRTAANTKWIRIGVSTSDAQARAMWKNYFDYTAKVAGLPSASIETGDTGTESYIVIHGSDISDTGDYDIKTVATNATYTALLYGVGG